MTPPNEFALLQNYPNPFNPTTQIRYELPERSHVLVRVFDILGRQIALLADEIQAPGTHRYIFPSRGQSLPSGVYVYSVVAGGKVGTRKMVLIK